MNERSGLDHPDAAQFAWARFRRILRYMNLVALAAGGLAALWLSLRSEPVSWVFAALTFAGIYLTVLMAAALMGLMFLSSGTGHDEQIMDMTEGGHPLDDD